LGGATGWLPEVFGGRTEWFSTRPPYPHPVIAEISQIERLRPNFEASELYQAILRHLRFFRKTVGDRIPIGAPDLQRPRGCGLHDFRLYAIGLCNDGRTPASACVDADGHGGHDSGLPCVSEGNDGLSFEQLQLVDARGIFMSDDLQAVLNAELYREFAVPYNEILAAEFGGLGLHSCGRILHNIEDVVGTKA